MKKLLERNLWLLKTDAILNGLVRIWGPISIIFQMRMIGLSLPEVLLGGAVFATAVFVFEIPSGTLADLWGRKRMMVFANGMFFVSLLVLLEASSFSHIVVRQIFFGIGAAAISGASSAFLFDTLKNLKREREHQKIAGNLKSIGYAIAIFTTAMAGFLGEISLYLPVIIATAIFFMKFLISLFLIEPKIKKHVDLHPLRHARRAVRFVTTHKKVRNLIFFSVIIVVASHISFITNNPFFEIRELPLWAFGLAFAFFNIVAATTSHFAHQFESWFGASRSFIIAWLVIVIGFTAMAGIDIGIASAIIFPAVFLGMEAFSQIVINDHIHQVTDSHHRATVLSVKSLTRQTVQIPALFLFALATGSFGLLGGYWILAGVTFVFGGVATWLVVRDI